MVEEQQDQEEDLRRSEERKTCYFPPDQDDLAFENSEDLLLQINEITTMADADGDEERKDSTYAQFDSMF